MLLKWFDADGFLNSGYMQNMDEDVRELVREKGVRNVTLNTIAPTGTTSTMVDTSGGIEPYFSFVSSVKDVWVFMNSV